MSNKVPWKYKIPCLALLVILMLEIFGVINLNIWIVIGILLAMWTIRFIFEYRNSKIQ